MIASAVHSCYLNIFGVQIVSSINSSKCAQLSSPEAFIIIDHPSLTREVSIPRGDQQENVKTNVTARTPRIPLSLTANP